MKVCVCVCARMWRVHVCVHVSPKITQHIQNNTADTIADKWSEYFIETKQKDSYIVTQAFKRENCIVA